MVTDENLIATCMLQSTTFVGEEAIEKSWLDEWESNTKAYQVDKLSEGNEVPKADRNFDA